VFLHQIRELGYWGEYSAAGLGSNGYFFGHGYFFTRIESSQKFYHLFGKLVISLGNEIKFSLEILIPYTVDFFISLLSHKS